MPPRKKNVIPKPSAYKSAESAILESSPKMKKQSQLFEEKQIPAFFPISKKPIMQWIPVTAPTSKPDEKTALEYSGNAGYIAFKEKVVSLNLKAKEIATAKPAEFIQFIKEVLEVIKLDIYLSETPGKQALLKEIP